MIVRANNAVLSVVRIFDPKPPPAIFYVLKEGDLFWQVDVNTGRFHRFRPVKSYRITAAKLSDVPADQGRFFVAFIEGRRKEGSPPKRTSAKRLRPGTIVVLPGGLLGRIVKYDGDGLPVVDRWSHAGWTRFGVEGRPLPNEDPRKHHNYAAASKDKGASI